MDCYYTQRHIANKFLGLRFRGRLQPNDPGGPWTSLARQLIDGAASLPRVHGSRSGMLRLWTGSAGLIRRLSGGFFCQTKAKRFQAELPGVLVYGLG